MTTNEALRILAPQTIEEAIAAIEYYGGFNGGKAKTAVIDEACRMAIEALRAQQERENPKPLTLEKLREMEGMPCYVVSGAFGDWRIPYFIDEGDYKGFIRFTDRSAEPINDYGKTWLAYRHKPREGKT